MINKVVAHLKGDYLNLSETFIYEYITRLKEFKSIVLAYKISNENLFPFPKLYEEETLKRISWWGFWDRVGRRLLNTSLYHEHIISMEKVQILHAHFGPEGLDALPLKRRVKLPLITSFYGRDVSVLPREYRKRLYERLFAEGDIFLALGSKMKSTLIDLGCPPEKIIIQHLGVDVNKWEFQPLIPPGNNELINIVLSGRLVEKKGIQYAIEAIGKIYPKYPNISFKIIGEGKLKERLSELISRLNLTNCVTLIGFLPHSKIIEELRRSHIFILPSVTANDGDSEGTPTVLMEAQACGIPVISTYHTDIPEVVLDGVSGFLVPERNSDALAERIEYLIEHPEILTAMGKAGRKHIEENYNIYREIEKIEDIYNRLL